MLSARRILDHGGLAISDVACRLPSGPGHAHEAEHHAVVFVRRGCFVRRAGAASEVLDPTRAYCIAPGQEQRYDHPHDGGDDCTSVRLDPALLASVWGGDPTLPAAPLPTSPQRDLEHRLLLAAARRRDPPDALLEQGLALVVAALDPVDPGRVASGRPSTADLGFADHSHLCRVIRAETGHTPSSLRHALLSPASS